MKDVGQRTQEVAALKHAVPYLALFRGRVFIVKVGGAAVEEPRAVATLAEQLAALHHLGIRVVVVHGGGPQADRLAQRLGLAVRKVAGRRVTDAATLETVTLAFNGEVNTRLLAGCRAAGLPAVGLSGVDGNLLRARRRGALAVEGESEPVDFGYVGEIEGVDPRLLLHLLEGGFVPVVSPLAANGKGELLNLNADTVAACLAVALGAEKLILLVEPPGILEDAADSATLVSYLDLAGLARLRAQGSLGGGMLPKAAAIESALRGGVARAHLLSWRTPDGLLAEVFTNEGAGTMIVAELASLSSDERSES